MNRAKNRIAIYPIVLALFGAALWAILSVGSGQPAVHAPAAAASSSLGRDILRNTHAPIGVMLLQILVILAFTRGCARVIKRFGQPEVIGEVIGGIVLGPSVLGWAWPAASGYLFPASSLGSLGLLSQIGLVVFMFVVGMELDTDVLKKRAHAAVLISHASIMLPFLLGALLSLFLYKGYAPAGVPFAPFCLFLGIAMSITAFPVLARLLQERGMTRSPLGTVALTCAAVDDVTAWCGLAAVAAVARQTSVMGTLVTVGLLGLHVGFMVFAARPLLSRWLDDGSSREALAGVLLLAFFSAFVTETMGLHALFGAFLAGVIVPRKAAFREALAVRLENFSTLILLPLFFALSGLRTQIGLLDSWSAWLVCSLIILVAIVGKFVGSAAAARWSGSPWRESLALGALMNTRGLVELVALNVGYDLGVITPSIFTMMVLMALATTLMTGPLLSLLLASVVSRPIPAPALGPSAHHS